jgi:hypothetical protein
LARIAFLILCITPLQGVLRREGDTHDGLRLGAVAGCKDKEHEAVIDVHDRLLYPLITAGPAGGSNVAAIRASSTVFGRPDR